jgi:ASC-1-like (ASCH) protein
MKFGDIHEHMYRVVHKNLGTNPPNPQEIVKNARYMLDKAKDERYNVILNNCEHVANLCVTKRRISLQINQTTERIISRLLLQPPKWFKYMVGKLGKLLLKFLRKFEEVLGHVSKLAPAFDFLKRYLGNWLGCTFFIAMLFMAKDVVQFILAQRNEDLCGSCVQKWVVKTACRVLSMLPFEMVLFLSAVGIGFTGFLAYDALYRKSYSYTELRTLRSIKPGDVITFNLYMPFSFHEVIVIQSVQTFTAGTMQALSKPFSTTIEVFEKSLSILNNFCKNATGEEYRTFQYLRMFVERSETAVTSRTAYPKVH